MGGFGQDFGRIFARFFAFLLKLRFCKNIEKSMVFRMFCKGRPLEKHQKIIKKSTKNRCKFKVEKKGQKIDQKSHLGGSWTPFGRGLGRPGASFGHSWVPLGRFLGVRNRAFIRHWSKMGSKKPFGSILDGFGEDFGRIWKDLGRV